MSDRAKVNISFTYLLQQYKLKVLPNIIEGWEELTNEQKLMYSKVNNFFCALHLLVNIAECACPILRKIVNVSGSTVNNLTNDEDNGDENERKQTLYN